MTPLNCEECNGTGEVEKTIHRGEEVMQIEMDVMVECSECNGTGLTSEIAILGKVLKSKQYD